MNVTDNLKWLRLRFANPDRSCSERRRKTRDDGNAKNLRDRGTPFFTRCKCDLKNVAECLSLIVIRRKLQTERRAAWIEKVDERVVAATKRKLRKRRERSCRNLVQRLTTQDTSGQWRFNPLPCRNLCVRNESHVPLERLSSQTVVWQQVLKRFGNPYNATPEWKCKRYAAAKYAVRSKQLRGDIHRGERGIN